MDLPVSLRTHRCYSVRHSTCQCGLDRELNCEVFWQFSVLVWIGSLTDGPRPRRRQILAEESFCRLSERECSFSKVLPGTSPSFSHFCGYKSGPFISGGGSPGTLTIVFLIFDSRYAPCNVLSSTCHLLSKSTS